MSLINQMLRDLEQRKLASGSVQPISGEVRVVSVVKEFRPTSLGILLVGMLIATTTWLYMSHDQPPPVAASVPAPVVTPVTAQATPALVNSAPALALDVDTKLGAPENVASKPVEPSPRSTGVDFGLSPALHDVAQLPVARAIKEKPVKSSQSTQPMSDTTPAALPAVETQAPTVDAPSKAKALPKPASTTPVALGKTTSATQQSDNLYRQSVTLLQQERVAEAQDVLRKSLWANSHNLKARQALVGLLVDNKHVKEASLWLKAGLKLSPEQSGFSMALARLQVELGDSKSARDTLEAGLSYANEDADYHAFYAALLQRDEQHNAAIQHYLIALRTNPAMPTWLVGIGISLQTQGQFNDATAAYQRARDTGQLTPQLTQFVESRLKQIKLAINSR